VGRTLGLVAAGIVALGAGAWLVDRALLWLESRGWIYWRRRKRLQSIGADLMQEGSPAAQAIKQSMQDERMRKNVRPAEEPPIRVDLDAGVVRIRREQEE
jgi:hypothetical protein